MHGLSIEARLKSEPSYRSMKIPDACLKIVKAMIKDSFLEGYDLRHSYAGYGYDNNAPVINGRLSHGSLRKDAWEESTAKEELEERLDYKK